MFWGLFILSLVKIYVDINLMFFFFGQKKQRKIQHTKTMLNYRTKHDTHKKKTAKLLRIHIFFRCFCTTMDASIVEYGPNGQYIVEHKESKQKKLTKLISERVIHENGSNASKQNDWQCTLNQFIRSFWMIEQKQVKFNDDEENSSFRKIVWEFCWFFPFIF